MIEVKPCILTQTCCHDASCNNGTKQRKSRRLARRLYLNMGPNYLWHTDGYDKLKPYGIAIHVCIDG